MNKVTDRPSILTCRAYNLTELTDELALGFDRQGGRRTLIFAAGVVNNKQLLKDLGSPETSTWYEGRRAADPKFKNPYWPDRG